MNPRRSGRRTISSKAAALRITEGVGDGVVIQVGNSVGHGGQLFVCDCVVFGVTLILLYLLVLVLVAAVLFVIASAVFGRGEPLPPLPRATTATVLPASGVTGADVDAIKFTQTLRGYKTSEVDWVLDRLSSEIELLRGQLSALLALTDNIRPARTDSE